MKDGEPIDIDIPPEVAEWFSHARTTEELNREARANAVDWDSDPEFVADYIKMRFCHDVLIAMEAAGLNKNSLAAKLGKKRQYISRVLSENPNFTIRTMAEIACALGMRLTLSVHAPQEAAVVLPIEDARRTLAGIRKKEPGKQSGRKLKPPEMQSGPAKTPMPAAKHTARVWDAPR